MSALDQMQTRLSLLCRLAKPGPCDEHAWREFVEHYAPLVYRWCRGHNLQDSDAKDVTQQVLLKLATHLPTFSYDPSKRFRAWLRTLTYHAWVDFLADRGPRSTGDPAAWDALASAECREDLLKRIEDAFDLELLEQAMARVRERVEPATWEAFRLTAIEGVPASEVALRLGKQVATVYVGRSNVQKMLRDDIALLESGLGGGASGEG
jgi:RNA polymerase sigma-70 factor (ECF subfamily)